MGYLGRRIGLSQDKGDSTPGAAGGAVGGGLLDLFAHGYFEKQGDLFNDPGLGPSSGLTATGGVISDYTSGSAVYRAHIFTTSGTFDVSALSVNMTNGDNIDYLVVGGGGGGGGKNSQSGGGGAGGFRTNLPGHPVAAPSYTASVGSYSVTIGAGGVSNNTDSTSGTSGGDSEFYPTPVSYPSTARIRAVGGGFGVGYAGGAGGAGGSGGGAANNPSPYAGGVGNTADPNHPQRQGYDGGDSSPTYTAPYAGGGGGGAGRVGAPDNPSSPLGRSTGGFGMQALIAGPPASPQPVGSPGPDVGGSATGYFAGGGGGGAYNATGAVGGYGGGGNGAPFNGTNAPSVGQSGTTSTGGGGGGGGFPTYQPGGSGGSGIVVVRYKIAEVATAKASGGAISFYGGKTIHAFTGSGNFIVSSGPISAELFIVAGGGGGGFDAAGGGGAGGVVLHPGLSIVNGTYTVTVGAGGEGSSAQPLQGSDGNDSIIALPTSYSARRGGGGGSRSSSDGRGGGSGGGGGRTNGNGGGVENPSPNPGATESGSAGGSSGTYAGGGGGAGSAGQPYGDDTKPGWGGIGIQAPTSFRNPVSSYGGAIPGTPGNSWGFAGGGGGGGNAQPDGSFGGSFGPDRIPGGPYYGGGTGALDSPSPTETNTTGQENTGGGGGGGNNGTPGGTPNAIGANGGSGIVLIAYPS